MRNSDHFPHSRNLRVPYRMSEVNSYETPTTPHFDIIVNILLITAVHNGLLRVDTV